MVLKITENLTNFMKAHTWAVRQFIIKFTLASYPEYMKYTAEHAFSTSE